MVDVESAMSDLESTHVPIGPGNTRIVPKDIVRLNVVENFCQQPNGYV